MKKSLAIIFILSLFTLLFSTNVFASVPPRLVTAGNAVNIQPFTTAFTLLPSNWIVFYYDGLTTTSTFRIRLMSSNGEIRAVSPIISTRTFTHTSFLSLILNDTQIIPFNVFTWFNSPYSVFAGDFFSLEVVTGSITLNRNVSPLHPVSHSLLIGSIEFQVGTSQASLPHVSVTPILPVFDVQYLSGANFVNPIQWPYPATYPRLELTNEQDISFRVRNHSSIRVVTGGATIMTRTGLPTTGAWTIIVIPRNLITWRASFIISIMVGDPPFPDVRVFDIPVAYTQTNPYGFFSTPSQGSIVYNRNITATGGVFNLPPNSVISLLVHHPLSNSTKELPVTISHGQWQAPVEFLGVGTYHLTLRNLVSGANVILADIQIEVAPPAGLIPPTLPPNAGILESIQHFVDVFIFWVSYPFVVIGQLLLNITRSLDALISSTGGFLRVMQTFWAFLPLEMTSGLTIAVPLLVILWALKR